jgi:predicted DCC family thiol-disulfide oxidoreductase YuxK
VQFIIKEDKKKIFRFSPFQSDFAKPIVRKFGLKEIADKSVILIINGKAYTKSSAILRILMQFGGYYKFFALLMYLIPAFLRDIIYNFISSNRYKWFGRKETCMIPAEDLMERFL